MITSVSNSYVITVDLFSKLAFWISDFVLLYIFLIEGVLLHASEHEITSRLKSGIIYLVYHSLIPIDDMMNRASLQIIMLHCYEDEPYAAAGPLAVGALEMNSYKRINFWNMQLRRMNNLFIVKNLIAIFIVDITNLCINNKGLHKNLAKLLICNKSIRD